MTTETEAYLTLAETSRRTAIPPRSLANRITAAGVPIYLDPTDRRRRLIAASDLSMLTRPRPVRPAEGARTLQSA